jgi:hypothetical protein
MRFEKRGKEEIRRPTDRAMGWTAPVKPRDAWEVKEIAIHAMILAPVQQRVSIFIEKRTLEVWGQ